MISMEGRKRIIAVYYQNVVSRHCLKNISAVPVLQGRTLIGLQHSQQVRGIFPPSKTPILYFLH